MPSKQQTSTTGGAFKIALSYDDVLLVPKYSEVTSRADVDLTAKLSPSLTLKTPLISTKMDTVTGVDMALEMDRLGGMGILPRFEPIDSQARKVAQVKEAGASNIGAAVGVKEDFMERTEALVTAGANVIDVDVAHGHMQKTIDVTKQLKQRFNKKITLFSGITSTYECAHDLYSAGADVLLVGVGAGSICTTRIMTGFGVPGFQSLLETAKAARKHKKTFVPDAGIRNSGDIVKALAAGASAIVAGRLFAGTTETPGDIVIIDDKKYKRYNGSASFEEKKKQVERLGERNAVTYTLHVEGVSGAVPYKGHVADLVASLLAGVRSGFAYAGALTIEELWEKAEFIRVTGAGLHENGAHDVVVV